MAKEIERKFLVVNDSYKNLAIRHYRILQGYLSVDPKATVRVRVKDSTAFLTIKSITRGFCRDEWEYPIPFEEAKEMLEKCCVSKLIEKERYIVRAKDGLFWEIDEFLGEHAGLILAEIELPKELHSISLPSFIGKEVSDDPRFFNSNLSK